MSNITTPWRYRVDLNLGTTLVNLPKPLMYQDKNADNFVLETVRDGTPVNLSGASCSASFRFYADNTMVPLKGTISGNVCTVTLPPECYTKLGEFSLSLQITLDKVQHTLLKVHGEISRTSSDKLSAAGDLPNIGELMAAMDDMESATTAANQAAARANAAAENAENFDRSGLADGLKYDEGTGNLQLTSGGEAIPGAKVTIKLTDSYTKAEVDAKFQGFEQSLGNLDIQGMTYYATYGTETLENGEEAEQVFTLWEVDKDGVETVKSRFVIQGGGGSGTVATNLKVERITPSPLILTPTDKAEISFSYSSTDSDGETIDGTYQLKLGTSVVAAGPCIHGTNTIDVTEHVNTGTQKLTLTVSDEGGSMTVKSWTVQIIDVRIESDFRDSITYPAGQPVAFSYTPYGAIAKTVHIKLDGVELPSATISTSGILQSYKLPAQTHGAHLLECWITAQVNTVTVETEHIYRDIIWWDEDSTVPVIGCIYRYDHYGKVTAKQYNTTSIPLYVFDPATASPVITKTADGSVVSTETLNGSSTVWPYKTSATGDHTLTVSCGDTSVTIVMDIVELGINVEPITAGLAFDFDPTNLSNTSADRLWRDPSTGVAMEVSDNFDWINGGYQLDADGNQFFCVRAGTRVTFDHKLFARDAGVYGAEFKLIFKVCNVRKVDTSFLRCVAGETPVGLRMDAHAAYLMTSATGEKPLYMPYSENDTIEFEFNIDPLDQEDTEASAVIMSYEDGVGYRPLIYDSTHRLYQYAADAVPIEIGSDDCEVHIYRMKAYTTALSDSAILSNFIADSRDADTMIARYERNQIYNENNELTPESVANACPQLKIIKIDAPFFTQDKGELVKDTIIECIHKGGDAVLDNWVARNCYHSGQGTTSNEYGYAGRNLNVYMCCDGNWTHKKVTHDPAYITQLTMGDGTTITDGTGKVTLTRTSVPNALFNIKVNIASSENANNSKLAMRFDRYLPYTPVSRLRDPNAKTTMEFCNCVVFIRENDPDLSKHREFADTGWHFYALGNIGDSKDTDQSRAYDPDDHNEFVVEISDNIYPNSAFPSGVTDASGKQVYPITEAQWVPGNPAYDSLHNGWDDTFEFRYLHPDVTDEEEAANIAVFNRFYKWVVTASDADFKAHLTDRFVPGAAEYMYTFTEHHTMTDNRAKNTFWHWAKIYITAAEAQAMGAEKAKRYIIDDAAAAINGGYRFDFWDYDNDTSIGINNSGEMTQPAGKEDVDYRTEGDPNSGYIYNAAESTFFCRVRDLMHSELAAMYLSRETDGCWDAESMIAEFDAWQEQFPEELWRLDIERKYIRTYKGGTKRFLETMLNGRKKYHRRQWLRDQAAYMGTKYVSANVKADQIMFRCNTPLSAPVAPNYDLKIIPYSDMYLSVMYGNSDPIQIRAKAGREYEIKNPLTGIMDDTAVLIYCASRIQAINDLSGAYIHDNDFSKAEKLQTLIIGNATSGYSNLFLTALNIGNNPLLETLDVRGCPNLTGSLNLTACGNLVTLLAQGTSLKGVTFAPSGAIQTAILPNTVNTLVMRNLHYLTGLQMGYDSLESLTEEYSVVDELAIVRDAADTLQTVKLAGIDWVLEDTSLLNAMLDMNSTALAGRVYIAGVVKSQELVDYMTAWPDLTVSYETLLPQNPVTFINWDGTVLDVQYVVVGEGAVDPITREENPIDTPTRPTTPSTIYTYSGWDTDFSRVVTSMTVKATYSETIREYTVEWYNGSTLLESQTVPYGSSVSYTGDEPTDTSLEQYQIYRLFNGWDKCTTYVKDHMKVNARFAEGYAPKAGEKTLAEMTPVELYACVRSGVLASNGGLNADPNSADYYGLITSGDEFDITLGHDVDYDNVESVEIVPVGQPMTFDGTNYHDTGIKLFDEDKSWTLSVDFSFDASTADAVLMSCCQGYGGFKLHYASGNPFLQYGGVNSPQRVASTTTREMLVIRHRRGDPNLYIYSSDKTNYSIVTQTATRTAATIHESTLAFGCNYSAVDEYAQSFATGTIYWAKVWYEDLGDDLCREFALWPRETLTMQAAGVDEHSFRLHTLTGGNGQYCACAFLMKHLMMDLRKMNPTAINTGGWPATDIRAWLNDRVYHSLPRVWQQVIRSVTISSTAGDMSTDIVTCEDYIWIPAANEVGAVTYKAALKYEVNGTINFFTSDTSRIKRMKNGEGASQYWHLRSPALETSTPFYYVHTGGWGSAYGAAYSNGICFGFCI